MTTTAEAPAAGPVVRDDLTADTRLIPIEDGYTAIVDAGDYERVAGRHWRILRGHNGKVYAYASITGGSLYMHRLIAETPAGHETDHINGDGLDNRRANLRVATCSQNSANMWKPKRPDGRPHTSIYKGVHFVRETGKWVAKITVAQRCKYLGSFTVEADAARAYDVAAVAAWGDFARLNFPRSGEAGA